MFSRPGPPVRHDSVSWPSRRYSLAPGFRGFWSV